jgi:hypothetical protein
MPIHDWSRVEAGIFHDFHHSWIEELKRALNGGVLPEQYYALSEQQLGDPPPPDLLVGTSFDQDDARMSPDIEMEFYRRKQNTVAVRHISGDRIVAMVEVVSPANKNSRSGLRSFVEKVAELLDKRVHLLILDLHPPCKRVPHGIHAAIWEEITGEESATPPAKPFTLAAYETALTVRSYVAAVAVGEALPEMPLFLEPGAHVDVPLEDTYRAAFAAVPRRWRRVLEPPTGGP